MNEVKTINLKFQNKEVSSHMPSSFEECISSFKMHFSLNNEKMKKLHLIYYDKNGEQISLDSNDAFQNFSHDNGKQIEGEILEENSPESKIIETKNISNLDPASLVCPNVVSQILKSEEKKFQIKEEKIYSDNKKESDIKNQNDVKVKETDDKINDINKNDKKDIINKINEEKVNKYNDNNNINNDNFNKINNKNNNNIEENVEDKSKVDERKNNENNNEKPNNDNFNNNPNINNINNNNINIKDNNQGCKINWFLILSVLINIIGILYYFYNKKIENEGKKIIIGIDFGSTTSGYSIIYDSNIELDDFDSKGIISSELIMDNETQIGLRIGNKAHYFPKNRIKPENKLYFCKFKKNLDPKNNNNYIESDVPKGIQIELANVIKGFLTLLREEIEINNKRIRMTNINDIKWIITVPPLWDEKGKQFMKEVAYEAGMIHSEIALEPEAASLSIFHDKNINKKYLEKGKTFLIVDAGGYTVDLSANKIIDHYYNLEQLLKPTSETFGSNLINERIIEIIETIYGKSTIEEIKKNDYEAWEKTLDEIEEKKKEIDDNTAENFKIDVKFIKKKCGIMSDICEGEYNGTKIEYSSNYINIPSKIIINIISEIAIAIVNIINKSFSKTNENIDLIVLTGGFSNCKIFEKKIRNNFKGSLKKLVFLKSPQETVMKGAAIFGLFPNQILYRISPATIIVNDYEYIKCESLDDDNGNSLCLLLKHKIFIERGKSVKTNEIIEQFIKPINETINIYYSFEDEINEKEINLLDTLDIPPSDLPLANRTITVSMKFSNYINVTVMDKESDYGNWKIVYYPS